MAQNRIKGPGTLIAVGGFANNDAVMKYIREYCAERSVDVIVPDGHEYINALGAAKGQARLRVKDFNIEGLLSRSYVPENPLPPLNGERVHYMELPPEQKSFDLSNVYLGVDCGSVSTKCVLLDNRGKFIG